MFFFFTLAGEALNMEVCVFDSHHLTAATLSTALTHDGGASTAGGRRAAVVVPSIKTRLVLNWWREESKRHVVVAVFSFQLNNLMKAGWGGYLALPLVTDGNRQADRRADGQTDEWMNRQTANK